MVNLDRLQYKESEQQHIPDLDPIDQFKHIHADQSLRANHQDIAQRGRRPFGVRIIQHGISERDVDEGIAGHYQDDKLGGPGNVMVDEAPPVNIVQLGVLGAVEASEQKGFDDELFEDEEDDEDDGEDEGGVGG